MLRSTAGLRSAVSQKNGASSTVTVNIGGLDSASSTETGPQPSGYQGSRTNTLNAILIQRVNLPGWNK